MAVMGEVVTSSEPLVCSRSVKSLDVKMLLKVLFVKSTLVVVPELGSTSIDVVSLKLATAGDPVLVASVASTTSKDPVVSGDAVVISRGSSILTEVFDSAKL